MIRSNLKSKFVINNHTITITVQTKHYRCYSFIPQQATTITIIIIFERSPVCTYYFSFQIEL